MESPPPAQNSHSRRNTHFILNTHKIQCIMLCALNRQNFERLPHSKDFCCFFFKRQTHFMTRYEEIFAKVSLPSKNADYKRNKKKY